MTVKVKDACNRWRSKTIAFRMSPEENKQLDIMVKLSGLTKQDYIIKRLLCREIVVQGNPRVYKALRDQLAAVLLELQRLTNAGEVNDELLDVIRWITDTMDGLKGE
ncbi:MAG: hypothetical protein RSC98_05885, partial [Clostridia bacterium]